MCVKYWWRHKLAALISRRSVPSLTLGAHAQRGLQYLVCVCECVCYSTSHFSCSQEEVYKYLSTHKSHTASGPDGVSCHMLRATARAITPAITSIFNKCLEQSKLPNDWKTSNVTPILKHGDPSSVLNYHYSRCCLNFLRELSTTKFLIFCIPTSFCPTVSLVLDQDHPHRKLFSQQHTAGISYYPVTVK